LPWKAPFLDVTSKFLASTRQEPVELPDPRTAIRRETDLASLAESKATQMPSLRGCKRLNPHKIEKRPGSELQTLWPKADRVPEY
jgi:hypothetical protein